MVTHDSRPTLPWEISIDPRGAETVWLPASIGISAFRERNLAASGQVNGPVDKSPIRDVSNCVRSLHRTNTKTRNRRLQQTAPSTLLRYRKRAISAMM